MTSTEFASKPESKAAQVRTLLASGLSTADIAKRVGCTRNLVYVLRSKLGMAAKRGKDAPTSAEPAPPTISAAAAWDQEFANLKARFPKVRDSIVFCVHVLQQSTDIAVDDLKARAAMSGFGINAASVAAARQLLAPSPAPAPARATVLPTAPATEPPAVATPQPPARSVHPAGAVDAEALVRNLVGKLQEGSSAEAARLREAIRKAIAVLNAALK